MVEEEIQYGRVISIIGNYLRTWSNKYQFTIIRDRERDTETTHCYTAIFSKPENNEPIAKNSVKVFFQCPKVDERLSSMVFNFDFSNFTHTPKSSFKPELFEEFIDRSIELKERNKQNYFLLTDFERTRISDPRIHLLEKKEEKEIFEEEKFELTDKKLSKKEKLIFVTDKKRVLEDQETMLNRFVIDALVLLDIRADHNYSEGEVCVLLDYFGIEFENRDDIRRQLKIPRHKSMFFPGQILYSLFHEILVSVVFLEKIYELFVKEYALNRRTSLFSIREQLDGKIEKIAFSLFEARSEEKSDIERKEILKGALCELDLSTQEQFIQSKLVSSEHLVQEIKEVLISSFLRDKLFSLHSNWLSPIENHMIECINLDLSENEILNQINFGGKLLLSKLQLKIFLGFCSSKHLTDNFEFGDDFVKAFFGRYVENVIAWIHRIKSEGLEIPADYSIEEIEFGKISQNYLSLSFDGECTDLGSVIIHAIKNIRISEKERDGMINELDYRVSNNSDITGTRLFRLLRLSELIERMTERLKLVQN